MHRRSMAALFAVSGLVLLILAGCGANSTPTPTLSSANATATACAQATRPAANIKTATGVLKSIDGQTLVLTNRQGNDVTATYSDKTRFTQLSAIPASALAEGTSVRVAVTSANGSYSATTIDVLNNANGLPRGNGNAGGGRRGNNPCARQLINNGTPGTGTRGFRGLVGTISQLHDNTLGITDTAGASYTVTITPQTQILKTQSATAAALKVGGLLTVAGRTDSQGHIAANTVALLPNLPNASPTPSE